MTLVCSYKVIPSAVYKCLYVNKMSTITVKMSKAINISKLNKGANTTVGTCRSYDEKQPIPSFIRSLGEKGHSKSKKGSKSLIFDESPES